MPFVLEMREVYMFVGEDGVNIHIDTPALRTWIKINTPKIVYTPVETEMAETFFTENVVSKERIIELAKRFYTNGKEPDPVIFACDGTYGDNDGPNVMLVDGHHRYALAAALGIPHIKAYLIQVEQWKPFQIKDIPELTREALINMPPTKRHY
jgi:hypothetical protein